MTPRFAQTLRWAARGAAAQPEGMERPPALRLSLSDLLHMHGESSGAVMLLLLALLSVAPIAGAGSLLSLAMMGLAWQWWCGRDGMGLPPRLGRLTLNATWTRRCLHSLAWLYETASARMRPRWARWSAPRARACWAAWIALMALLIFLPLPLGNVLPALSLTLLSLGWMFRDGVVLMLSGASGVLALAYAVSVTHLMIGWAQALWWRWLV